MSIYDLQCDTTEGKNKCTAVEICLLTGTLRINEFGCASFEPKDIPDGVVHSFSVRDGCVETLFYNPPATVVQQPPCACLPDDCAGGGGSGSGLVIHPDASNLSRSINGELLTKLYYQAGAGITISGFGTVGSPLVITADSNSQGTYIAGAAPITVSGAGTSTDPKVVRFNPTNVFTGAAIGFVVDNGLVVSYEAQDTGGLVAIIGEDGIRVDQDGTTATIGLIARPDAAGTYTFGGYDATINSSGIVTRVVERDVLPDADRVVYIPGGKRLTFSRGGALTNVATGVPTPSYGHYMVIETGTYDSTFEFPMAGTIEINIVGLISEPTISTNGADVFKHYKDDRAMVLTEITGTMLNLQLEVEGLADMVVTCKVL